MSVSQWMTGPRSTEEWYDIKRERYRKISIDNLIEEDQSRISTPLPEGTPSELPYHVCGVITKDPSSCPSLNTLYFLYVILVIGVLD